MITSTESRLEILEPGATMTALALAEGGVRLRIAGEVAHLDADDVASLIAWLKGLKP